MAYIMFRKKGEDSPAGGGGMEDDPPPLGVKRAAAEAPPSGPRAFFADRRRFWDGGRKHAAAETCLMQCDALLKEVEHTIDEAETEGVPTPKSRSTFREQAIAMCRSPLWNCTCTTRVAEKDNEFDRLRSEADNVRRVLRRRVFDPLNNQDIADFTAIQQAGQGAKEAQRLLQALRGKARDMLRAYDVEALSRQTGTL